MKNIETIIKRLRKLRIRYLRKYLLISQNRIPKNCIYNHEITTISTKHNNYGSSFSINDERPVADTKTTMVVVLNDKEEFPCVCIYGCEDPSVWEGELCYTVDKAATCDFFKPIHSFNIIENEFNELMKDDEYVRKHYSDIAALQWVIEDRIYKYCPSLIERILRWLLHRKIKVPKKLPVNALKEIESDFIDNQVIDFDIENNKDFDPKLKNLFR